MRAGRTGRAQDLTISARGRYNGVMPSWKRFGALVVPLALLTTQPAWAKPSNADRQTALKLGGEALDLFAAGDFEAALAKFREADALVPAPTLKLHIARCLDKLDRMKEAADTYREVIATELAADAPAVHREARKEAVPELAALLAELPSARVLTKGRGAAEAKVTMDDAPLDPSQLGVKVSLDPGHYRFEARVGERVVGKSIDLRRAQHEEVVLHLAEETTDVEPEAQPSASDGGAFRSVGWAAIAVGGAGVSLFSIAGVLLLSEEQDLAERCPERQCPPEAHDDARGFDTLRALTTTGMIVGGVGLATGITLLLLAPSSEAETAVRPLLGPGFVGVEGSF